MNWEVPTMKSKTSFFNAALAKNMLQRSWPAWLLFFFVLLMALPVQLLQTDWAWGQERLDWFVLKKAVNMGLTMYILSVLAAMVQFSFLYFPRSCGLVNALPLRRGTVYGTAFLTGLAAMLLAELLTVLATLLLAAGRPLRFGSLLQWLAVTAGTTLAGYGFAAFCAMLTGNLLVLPLVYLLFNTLAAVLCRVLNNILLSLLYGFSHFDPPLAVCLSPMTALDDMLSYVSPDETITGLGVVAGYAVLGLLFAVLGRLLYQDRRMECAGDAVAIPALKPVFRCCMAFGTALVLAGSLPDVFPASEMSGRACFLLTLLMLLIGAVVGWLAAQMLLQKSVRVFRSGWGGCAVCCAVLALLCLGIELDLTGYETRVPDARQVRSVTLTDRTITGEEEIALTVGLHRSLIAHRSDYDAGPRLLAARAGEDASIGAPVTIRYTMRDGRTLERWYHLVFPASQADNPGSDLNRYVTLMNSPEAIESVCLPILPFTAETLSSAYLEGERDGVYWNYSLSTDQALDLYENALLPEIKAGIIGRYEPISMYSEKQPLPGDPSVPDFSVSRLSLTVSLRADRDDLPSLGEERALQLNSPPGGREYYESKFYAIPDAAVLTRAWIAENTPYSSD